MCPPCRDLRVRCFARTNSAEPPPASRVSGLRKASSRERRETSRLRKSLGDTRWRCGRESGPELLKPAGREAGSPHPGPFQVPPSAHPSATLRARKA